jgi:hypothetical protein
MKIEVLKLAETSNSTLSKMLIDGMFYCFIIEDGYRKEKQPGETRIPDGTYTISKRTFGKFYNRYKKISPFIPQISDVPNFSDILIHPGNTIKDTRGCLLPNVECGFDGLNQVFWGNNSTKIFFALCANMEAAWKRGETITITLQRDEKSTN